jgi:hypothetical protein
MTKFIALFFATSLALAAPAVAANYSMEATITDQKDKGTYLAEISVSRLLEQNGQVVERVIARPRISAAPGVPASLYSGPQPSQADYKTEENVCVDVSWPEAGQGGFVICSVTVKLGDKVVSKSKMKVQIEAKRTA